MSPTTEDILIILLLTMLAKTHVHHVLVELVLDRVLGCLRFEPFIVAVLNEIFVHIATLHTDALETSHNSTSILNSYFDGLSKDPHRSSTVIHLRVILPLLTLQDKN
jgi:hypothetical protein